MGKFCTPGNRKINDAGFSYFATMKNSKAYPFKVREGSYGEMRNIIRFPEVTGPEIDGQVCRVTINNHALDLSLKREYLEQYKNDNVCQVRLLSNDERDFVVMRSMLIPLKETVIVNDKD